MIIISYERYVNDCSKTFLNKSFYSLKEFEDWFFGLCRGKYEKDISIPDPDSSYTKNGPGRISVNCVWTEGCDYWVHKIVDCGKIVFSDGKETNGIKHWNDDIKNLCREMIQRQNNPQFVFG